MVEALKIAAKVALIAVVTAGIIALFTSVSVLPEINIIPLRDAVATGKAIANYWFPEFGIWLAVAFGLLGFKLILITFQLGMIAVRWIFKVNE